MREKKEFNIVECSGTDYEIGKQYGTACRENILKATGLLLGGLNVAYNASNEQIISNARKYLPLVEAFDPDQMEMLRGEAEGAGVSFDEVFALKCALELGEYYKPIMALCTSFAATGEATKDGKTIIGQNVDWMHDFPMDLLKIRHTNGLEQLELVFGASFGIGLSSAGLGCVGNLTLSSPEDQRLTVPVGFVGSKAMRQKNLGDAIGVIQEVGYGLFHTCFASGEGDILGIETSPYGYYIVEPERDIIVHANHYLKEKFRKGDWGYLYGGGCSYIRLNRIKRLMNRYYGNLTAEVMTGIMADHNNYPLAICRHLDEDRAPEYRSETLVSVIMVPEDKTMYLTFGQPCKYEYVEYRL